MTLIQGGLSNPAAYLAAHVLLCLVPAFYIAGATPDPGDLYPLQGVHPNGVLFSSSPAAHLAVCSCTIAPCSLAL
jgi:hypothetical protein